MLPHNNEVALLLWGCLTTMWVPHNNVPAKQQCGCLTTILLSQNNVAASWQCGCLTTMCLPYKVDSKQWGYLKTIYLLPHNWGLLITLRLTHKTGIVSQNKFLITMRALARLAQNCRFVCLHSLAFATANQRRETTWQSELLSYEVTSV